MTIVDDVDGCGGCGGGGNVDDVDGCGGIAIGFIIIVGVTPLADFTLLR